MKWITQDDNNKYGKMTRNKKTFMRETFGNVKRVYEKMKV